MAVHYRSKGFVLGKKDFGEADQLFVVYTENFGKLEILGKAIRKISSKLRAGTELFYLSEIEFIQGKTHKTLTDAILIDSFKNIRNDLEKLPVAFKISEILNKLVKGQEPDKKLWQLLFKSFNTLNSLEKKSKNKIIYYYFLWNILSILGYRPEIHNCSLCQKKIKPGDIYFSQSEGGLICNQCKEKIKSLKKIEPDIIKILRITLEKDWQILEKLKIEDKDLKSLREISDYYFRGTLEENK